MTTGIVLIAAILVLGAVIATVGDRIGMRVGKARLSLFNLRPRQTATLITILTGIIISASTFGILFAIDDQLRTGVFELRDIQQELSTARGQVEQARVERRRIQRERNQALEEQRDAQVRLARINRSLGTAIAEQQQTERQLNRTQTQLGQVESNFQQAQALLRTVSQQAGQLRDEIQQLQADRQREIARRDLEIAERNRQIEERNQAIAEREVQLRELENQRTFLVQEVLTYERELQGLRTGNVALLRNQPLSSGVVRIVTPEAAPQAVDQLLREANRTALQRVRPGTTLVDAQVIQITRESVEQLVQQIQAGQDYVIRVLSAGNYVVGEPCVLAGDPCIQVYIAAAPNQVIFQPGDVIASTAIDVSIMGDDQLVDRINLLIAASQFRTRQAGVLTDTIQIADGRTETVIAFFDQLQQYNQSVDIQAIASDVIYTAGPVRLDLVAVKNGQVLFSTRITRVE